MSQERDYHVRIIYPDDEEPLTADQLERGIDARFLVNATAVELCNPCWSHGDTAPKGHPCPQRKKAEPKDPWPCCDLHNPHAQPKKGGERHE